jgi:hypothetical protein
MNTHNKFEVGDLVKANFGVLKIIGMIVEIQNGSQRLGDQVAVHIIDSSDSAGYYIGSLFWFDYTHILEL